MRSDISKYEDIAHRDTNESDIADKAFGELPCLCNDALVEFNDELMPILYPLYCKSYAQILPPIQLKGGMIAALFKGKGSSSLSPGSRDILLTDDCGKSLMVHARGIILPSVRHMSLATQYGSGMNGGETALAHMHVRQCFELAKTANQSGAVLFLDVSTAFASMLRRIVFVDWESGDEQWLKQLQNAGFPDEEIRAIYDHICDFSFGEDQHNVQCNGVDPGIQHAYPYIQQMYTNTWGSYEGIDGIIDIKQGCCAGTPTADLIFSIAMFRICCVSTSQLRLLALYLSMNMMEHGML